MGVLPTAAVLKSGQRQLQAAPGVFLPPHPVIEGGQIVVGDRLFMEMPRHPAEHLQRPLQVFCRRFQAAQFLFGQGEVVQCELTDRLLEAVMITMIKEGRRVMKDPNNYDARANIMWAAMVAQNNSTGVGRAQDWGTHHMDNEIGINYGASHGAGLALLFPYWMQYAMKTQGPELFVKYATRVWGFQNDFEHPETTAMQGIQAFRDFMTEIGMPATIGELGGKEADIPGMVENMFHGAPNHGNFVKLTPEIAAEIYRMAM